MQLGGRSRIRDCIEFIDVMMLFTGHAIIGETVVVGENASSMWSVRS